MKANYKRDGAQETIGLTNPTRPLVVFFLVMPVAILLAVAVIMLMNKVTALFVVVFSLVVVSLGWLAITALETLCETQVQLLPDGVHVIRLLGTEVYPWTDIQQVKIVPASRTFADDPAREDGAYVGLGLFLASKAKERGDGADPDALLFSAAGHYTEDFMKMRDMIQAYKARLAGRGGPIVKRIGAAPQGRKAAEFRRKSAGPDAKAS